jgi:hypothetical protein
LLSAFCPAVLQRRLLLFQREVNKTRHRAKGN